MRQFRSLAVGVTSPRPKSGLPEFGTVRRRDLFPAGRGEEALPRSYPNTLSR